MIVKNKKKDDTLDSRGLRVIQRLATVTKWFNSLKCVKEEQWGTTSDHKMIDGLSDER